MISEPKKIKSVTVSVVPFDAIVHEVFSLVFVNFLRFCRVSVAVPGLSLPVVRGAVR